MEYTLYTMDTIYILKIIILNLFDLKKESLLGRVRISPYSEEGSAKAPPNESKQTTTINKTL